MANKFSTSYSRWSVFNNCPFQYDCKFNKKIPEEQRYFSERGNIIHAKAEHFVKGNITGMPDELSKFSSDFRSLRNCGAKTEIDVAINKDWNPSFGTDWDNVWVRAKVDALGFLSEKEAVVVDYKTGKVYDSHKGQGELYAPLVLAHYPKIKIMHVEFWYLDSGEYSEVTYLPKKLKDLKMQWTDRFKKQEAAKKFKATPSTKACQWCSFRKSKGGVCKYG